MVVFGGRGLSVPALTFRVSTNIALRELLGLSLIRECFGHPGMLFPFFFPAAGSTEDVPRAMGLFSRGDPSSYAGRVTAVGGTSDRRPPRICSVKNPGLACQPSGLAFRGGPAVQGAIEAIGAPGGHGGAVICLAGTRRLMVSILTKNFGRAEQWRLPVAWLSGMNLEKADASVSFDVWIHNAGQSPEEIEKNGRGRGSQGGQSPFLYSTDDEVAPSREKQPVRALGYLCLSTERLRIFLSAGVDARVGISRVIQGHLRATGVPSR